MSYYLGVDLGTTYTAAAVWRDGRVEVVSLGNRAPVIPSVVLLKEDEAILTGEAANRRAATEPGRVAREFKRRMGDPTPIILGGAPYSAPALMGRLLRWVVDAVSEREGGPPTGIAVSHPANWGDFKKDLLDQAIQVADLDGVVVVTEPEAAAIHYASQERVDPGSTIAVYDLGGGTFDAAVLRKTETGFELLGEPQGIERLGGIDFDEAVFQHVVRATGGAVTDLDPEDPAAVAAVSRLREECVEAKEALSADTDVSIPVLLPNVQTEVRLTRAEFEQLVRPPLGDTLTTMNRALRSAAVEAAELSAVLLVGGSSRIPLVAQLVGAELGRPVAVDAHPKHGIALGAAVVAAEAGGTGAEVATEVAPSDESEQPAAAVAAGGAAGAAAGAVGGAALAGAGDDGGPPTEPLAAADVPTAAAPPAAPGPPPQDPLAPSPPPAGGPTGGSGKKKAPVGIIVAIVALLVVGGVVAALALLGGGDDSTQTAATSESDEPETTTTTAESSEATTEAAPTGPTLQLDGVELVGDRYQVTYRPVGFEPLISQDAGTLHVHVFLNPPTAPANAGTDGQPPGDWEITDEPSTLLTRFGPSDAQPGGEICVVVANPDHSVFDVATASCLPLPS